MSDLKDKFENLTDKTIAKANEFAGKSTDNQQTELKGKLQSKEAYLKERFDHTKENIAEKINDKLDEEDQKNK